MKSYVSAILAGGLALAVVPGYASNEVADGFLCCNMRTDGSWISDSNYMEEGKTMIPAGTPVKYRSFGRYRVNIEVDGKKQSIGNDYSREIKLDVFAKRYIVQDDPKAKIAAASPRVRQAIESARVTKGMTREQVLMALGYPISSENPNLDATEWKFWLFSFSPFTVIFDKDNRVSKVDTDPDTLRKVYLD